jgi:hypothetical protein
MSTPSLLNIPYVIKAGTLYSQIPETGAGDFTVSRTTSPTANRSTRINADGFIELVNDNVPRLDYPVGGAVNGCPALLVEPSATNGIRNNSMVGAVSGGALPTNWSFGTGAGVSGTVTAVGTENGIPYIDLRINGTATATSVQVNIETANQIAALNGQVWTISSYLKTIASPLPPISSALLITERTSGGASSAQNTLAISLTSSLARYPYSVTLNGGPTTAFAQPRLSFSFTIGQPYDFTIRIGYPQMELGSVATSVIPTTTQAITRAADIVRKTGITSLIGQSEGTVYFEVEVTDEARNKWFCSIDSVAGSFIQMYITPTRTIAVQIQNSSSVVMAQLTSSALTVGYHKIAFAYNTATNGCIMYIDGVQNPVATRTVVAPGLPAFSNMSFGTYFSTTSDTLKAHVRAGAVYPNRLSNSELIALTTP